eukprot:11104654-Lingulodinium_polyedra.AAC.1
MGATRRGMQADEALCCGDGKTRRRIAPRRVFRSSGPFPLAHRLDIWADVARAIIDHDPEFHDALV